MLVFDVSPFFDVSSFFDVSPFFDGILSLDFCMFGFLGLFEVLEEDGRLQSLLAVREMSQRRSWIEFSIRTGQMLCTPV